MVQIAPLQQADAERAEVARARLQPVSVGDLLLGSQRLSLYGEVPVPSAKAERCVVDGGGALHAPGGQTAPVLLKWGIDRQDPIFPVTKWRAHQLLQRAFERSGVQKPPHVGAVHVLRHSGALERLKDTGNPQALQEHLGHSTAKMTLRYMKTLTAEEALKINQAVDFRW